MRFASLGSGSEGNALIVECGPPDAPVRLLIDCGFGVREARRRLERLGVDAASLDALLVTHEHSDHIGGAARLAASAGVSLYLTGGTARAGLRGADERLAVVAIEPDVALEIRGVRVDPVPVPHDAREPVQFVVDDGTRRLGVLTDLGHPTAHVLRSMARLDAIVLECNHDEDMLRDGPYPPALKRRIGGNYGHLANRAAAHILGEIVHDDLRTIVAAHLSQSNNHPDLARVALARACGRHESDILVADQDTGLDWIAV
ncbi:MAG: MBL fold metallo-hydrolase [Burkholderiaceae bacterium]